MMLEFTILLFAALAFSRERELGTIEQLLVMPFSSLEIIIGKSIPVILVGFTDFLIMLGMVHFAFDVPVRGSLVLLLALAIGAGLYVLYWLFRRSRTRVQRLQLSMALWVCITAVLYILGFRFF